MENRIKRLIAIGASVAANCQSCLQNNVSKAKEVGVDAHEISEAIEVGMTVRKGAASKIDEFASKLTMLTSSAATATNDESACCS